MAEHECTCTNCGGRDRCKIKFEPSRKCCCFWKPELKPIWIPCSEMLPGRFDSVLLAILSKNGYGEPAYYVTIGGMKNGTEFESYTGDICECETVTHWMPLPEPPEKE